MSKTLDALAFAFMCAGFYALWCVTPAWAAAHHVPAETWKGEAAAIAFVCVIGYLVYRASTNAMEREQSDDDLEALRRQPDDIAP